MYSISFLIRVGDATVTVLKLLAHSSVDVGAKEKVPFAILDFRVDSVIRYSHFIPFKHLQHIG